MEDNKENPKSRKKVGTRKHIGVVDPLPVNLIDTPEGLSPAQAALREATIKQFSAFRVRAFIDQQLKHINSNEHIAEEIRSLFDEGQPPKNIPLEDIISERRNLETQIKWLEALSSEMKNQLATVMEIEESAMQYSQRVNKD